MKTQKIQFTALHKAYENKKTDLCLLQKEDNFDRYILIRSLDKKHLQEILALKSEKDIEVLYETAFCSANANKIYIDFIRQTYPSIRNERVEQEQHLAGIINEFGVVNCGVRNDDLNDLAKSLVRDKTIKTYKELTERIKKLTNERVSQYLEWQYYNQASNDLIEHFFNDHKNVLPTLRKIRDIDFFILQNNTIVPFDLKITHISDDYFDLLSSGLKSNSNKEFFDSFIPENQPSEIEIIKAFYKENKDKFSLPNLGGLDKESLIEIISKSIPSSNQFIAEQFSNRKKMIEETQANPSALEWWNYKFQGERLFKNNNRFFVFLAFSDSFGDARPLKGQQGKLKKLITDKLDNFSIKGMSTINYRYEKDRSLRGDYTANSSSVLLVDKSTSV